MSEDKREPSDAQAEIDRVRDEIQAAPAPGTDPDAVRIAAKHEAARQRNAGLTPEDEVESKARASKVQGRTATPPNKAKAAEEK